MSDKLQPIEYQEAKTLAYKLVQTSKETVDATDAAFIARCFLAVLGKYENTRAQPEAVTCAGDVVRSAEVERALVYMEGMVKTKYSHAQAIIDYIAKLEAKSRNITENKSNMEHELATAEAYLAKARAENKALTQRVAALEEAANYLLDDMRLRGVPINAVEKLEAALAQAKEGA